MPGLDVKEQLFFVPGMFVQSQCNARIAKHVGLLTGDCANPMTVLLASVSFMYVHLSALLLDLDCNEMTDAEANW